MRFDPLRPARPRPWAFITFANDRASEIITDDGEVSRGGSPDVLLSEIGRLGRTHTILTANLMQLVVTTDARGWTARQRRSRVTSARHDNGARVIVLPAGTFTAHDPDARYRALALYLRWLAAHGVGFTARSSWGTLAAALWRSTLIETVRFAGPDARAAMYGGRKEAPYAWRFGPCSRWDLSAAYPAALAAGVPSRLAPAARPGSILAADVEGIARARVVVPDVDPFTQWAPLPVVADARSRKHLRWATGEIEGTWPLAELRQAADAGCTVEVIEAWAGQRDRDAFAGWWKLVTEARATLEPDAARLVKHHANLLWSSFAVSASPIVWKRWADRFGREPYKVKVQAAPKGDPTASTVYVSAIVAGRVRARLWREGLLRDDGTARSTVVFADTDGFIAGAGETPAGPAGGVPGEWRREGEIACVEIRHASAYRFRPRDDDPWQYRVAGAHGPDAAMRRFRSGSVGGEAVALPVALCGLDRGAPDFRAREIRSGRQMGRYRARRGRGRGSADHPRGTRSG